MSLALQQVLKRGDIWQASQRIKRNRFIVSGYTALDSKLHLGGWPIHRLTEILTERPHIGEMKLLLPSIARLLTKGGQLFLIEPPFIPYAPGWLNAGIDLQQITVIRAGHQQDALWAAEQVIANKGVSCCLFWPEKDYLPNKILKRLQVAAEQGSRLNFIFRSQSVAQQSSPASLRLMLKSVSQTDTETVNIQHRKLAIEIIKQQAGWAGQKITLDLSSFHKEEKFSDQVKAINNLSVRAARETKTVGL